MGPVQIVQLLNELMQYNLQLTHRLQIVEMADELLEKLGMKVTTTDTEPIRYTIRTLDSYGL